MPASKFPKLLQVSQRVHIKDLAKVEEKVSKLVAGGWAELQFIVDFDYTLTRAHKDGVPVHCSWGVLENYEKMGAEYFEAVDKLRKKYYPMELDLSMPLKEKIPKMVEWYTNANRLLTQANVNKDWYPDMVQKSTCELRDDTDTLMNKLDQQGVPFLILSAGLGDLINEILKHFQLLKSNVKVVSNFCEYDEAGVVSGLKDPMIHMFNKSEASVHDPELKDRHNIVLIGDSLGDLKMADGVEDTNVVLSIGFLNPKSGKDGKKPEISEDALKLYTDKFDVVLVDDQTMDFPLALLKEVEEGPAL